MKTYFLVVHVLNPMIVMTQNFAGVGRVKILQTQTCAVNIMGYQPMMAGSGTGIISTLTGTSCATNQAVRALQYSIQFVGKTAFGTPTRAKQDVRALQSTQLENAQLLLCKNERLMFQLQPSVQFTLALFCISLNVSVGKRTGCQLT